MRIENSYIPVHGVGETTERRLWESGATRWAEFSRDLVGETTAERIDEFIAEAGPRLDDGDATYFDREFPDAEQWRLYENFREGACFFDIETTGLDHRRDRVTTVSFHRDGDTRTLVAGEDLTAAAVRRQFEAADLLVTFNGKRFDVPFLETSLDIDVETPHMDLMYTCRKLDLSGGLKRIEREVGIERDRPDVSGRDAVRLWREYEAGDDGALETLVSYNREDAVNLRALADRATTALHDRVWIE